MLEPSLKSEVEEDKMSLLSFSLYYICLGCFWRSLRVVRVWTRVWLVIYAETNIPYILVTFFLVVFSKNVFFAHRLLCTCLAFGLYFGLEPSPGANGALSPPPTLQYTTRASAEWNLHRQPPLVPSTPEPAANGKKGRKGTATTSGNKTQIVACCFSSAVSSSFVESPL